VPACAIRHVDERHRGAHDHGKAAACRGEQQPCGAVDPAGSLHGRRIHGDDLDAQVPAERERRRLGLGLGPLVRRQEPPPVRRVLAPGLAGAFADRRRGGRQDQAPDAGAGRRLDGVPRADHVGPKHRARIAAARGDHARGVHDQFGAREGLRHRLGLEHVTGHGRDARSDRRDGGLGCARPRERADVVPGRQELGDDGGADEAARAGDRRDRRHVRNA
jgi:hypothetical protein